MSYLLFIFPAVFLQWSSVLHGFNLISLPSSYVEFFLVLQDSPTPRAVPRHPLVKYGLGGLILFLLIFIIWLPLLLFSMSNSIYEPNPPKAAQFKLSIGGYNTSAQVCWNVQAYTIYISILCISVPWFNQLIISRKKLFYEAWLSFSCLPNQSAAVIIICFSSIITFRCKCCLGNSWNYLLVK